jgi:hypothetical protein
MQPGTNGVRRLRLAGSRGARAAALGVAGTAAAAAIIGIAVPAGATALPQHHAKWGTEHFQLASDSTSQTSTTSPIIAYGVFTASGTDYQNQSGTDTFVFAGGSFNVIHSPAPGSSQEPTFSTTTCMFQLTQTGTFKLAGGTGRYRHIVGHGTYTLSVIGIATRLANGQCNPSQTAPLAAQQQIIQAVGQVRLH